MRGGVRPVHSKPVGDVPGVSCPPPGHAQLLHQLPHLLLRLCPLQKGTLQGEVYSLCCCCCCNDMAEN